LFDSDLMVLASTYLHVTSCSALYFCIIAQTVKNSSSVCVPPQTKSPKVQRWETICRNTQEQEQARISAGSEDVWGDEGPLQRKEKTVFGTQKQIQTKHQQGAHVHRSAITCRHLTAVPCHQQRSAG